MPELLPLRDVAHALRVEEREVSSLLRDGKLLGVRRDRGRVFVPAEFLDDGHVVKHLSGVVNLLRDNNFSDDEAVAWLFAEDPSLPGSPVQALRENRATEVKRRAQALGW